LKTLDQGLHIDGYSDVSMRSYFYGIEVSSRLSYGDLSFRFGRQISNGKINYWDYNEKEYNSNMDIPINEDQFVVSLGLALHGKIYKSNNMLRLWDKPILDIETRRSKVKKPESDENFFDRINIFNKKDSNK
jgi:hypothetical protein